MTRLDFELGAPLGTRANMGLIVLRTDETIEAEARLMLPDPGVAHYVSRVPSETCVTLDALATMEAELPASAALLPSSLDYDVIGYGCTSGATRIGPERVAAAVRQGACARHVTNPLSAVIAAARALGARRLGFVTPYVAEVSAAMRAALEAEGFEIAGFGAMEEESDERIARIAPDSLRAAIREVAAMAPSDAVFLSCTNLRGLGLIAEMEAEIGRPVLTSNQALLWHMRALAGLDSASLPYGALMDCALPGAG